MASAHPPASPWAPLAVPLFRTLWLASVVSGVGGTMHDTAAVWTLATLTPSPVLVTLMQTMASLPLFLFALPAGALADLLDKRRFLIWTQLAAALAALLLAGLAWAGGLTVPVLLGGTFLLGVVAAFTNPGWASLMPEIIEKRHMPGAVALGAVGVNLARAIGPLVGGLLVAAAGPGPVFALNAASFLGIVVVLARWRRPDPPRRPNAEHVLGAMVAAARHVRHAPAIRRVLVRHGLFTFAGVAPVALLPLLVKHLGLPAAGFGALMGGYGVGGILVALFLLPRLRARFHLDTITLGAGLAAVTATGLLALAKSPWAVGALMILAGAAWLTMMAQMNVAGQSVFPHWIRARASATQLIAVQGGIALGAVVWGQLTGSFSLAVALAVAAGVLLLQVVVARALPLGAALDADLEPAADPGAHGQLGVKPADSEGPVLVLIRYQVAPAREAEFLRATLALRDVRLRDGAFRWDLWRDLQEAGVFHEAFLVGSWGEHERQHARTTVADRAVKEAVLACHAGPEPPRVRHSVWARARPAP
ncbi:MAG: MFS transporter [Limisphaerales bacterium]